MCIMYITVAELHHRARCIVEQVKEALAATEKDVQDDGSKPDITIERIANVDCRATKASALQSCFVDQELPISYAELEQRW